MNVAEMTFTAFLRINIQLENIPASNEAEECSKRAEIAAPESFSGKVEKYNSDEERADKKALEKNGIDGQGFEELN